MTTRAAFLMRHRKKLLVLLAIVALPFGFHFLAVFVSRVQAPSLGPPSGEAFVRDEIRWLGESYVRKRGAIWEARLAGTPDQIGHAHAKLFYREMVEGEAELYRTFEKFVPLSPVRTLLIDIAKFKYRGLEVGIDPTRRLELAAQARAFDPDPFSHAIPTYQRFLYLQSLYDISLSFEHSPLLGCTSFVAKSPKTQNGEVILGRNFDFEAGSTYDLGKAVFLIAEKGKLPYASVAWPGFVGAVTGINAEGVAVVIHGGRAREPREAGEPVVHTVRRILSEARNVSEAIAVVAAAKPMVSHILLIADAQGASAVIERAPGEEPHIRTATEATLGLSNHFEGPLRTDPRNRAIEERTSTHPRRKRIDELLSEGEPINADSAVTMLRDKRGSGGVPLSLGHRSSLDAIIATHGVVMETTKRTLWVSEGPHLMGRFLRFDLAHLFAQGFAPSTADPVVAIAEDPLYLDGTFATWQARGAPHEGRE